MKKILLAALILIALSSPALAIDRYAATATTTALTIQQPATGARTITFNNGGGVSVYCPAAQTATFSWNGTAATATAGTELQLPGTSTPSGATIWTASNVGAGTTGPVNNIPAGVTVSLSMDFFVLQGNGTANNITVTTSGSCTITFAYSVATI